MQTSDIIDAMTTEQRKSCRDDIGDALDIVSEIVGDMPYSRLFAIVCDVIEKL